MIALYSGTPGSGKSFHTCEDIYYALRWQKKNVIANFPIKPIKKQKGRFVYKKNDQLTNIFSITQKINPEPKIKPVKVPNITESK